jgi:hypothetical protein
MRTIMMNLESIAITRSIEYERERERVTRESESCAQMERQNSIVVI